MTERVTSAGSKTVAMLVRNDPSQTPSAMPGPYSSTAASAIPAGGQTAAA